MGKAHELHLPFKVVFELQRTCLLFEQWAQNVKVLLFADCVEHPLLQGRPEYSIALANEGAWDAETGWNKLFEL